MRIVNFQIGGQSHLGVRDGDDVIDLAIAAPELPQGMNEFLTGGDATLAAAKAAAVAAPQGARRAFKGLDFLPPSDRPSKILCLGVNYLAHAREGAIHLGQISEGEELPAPDFPPIFLRGPSSLAAHDQPIIRPRSSIQLDYECELAIIIGKTARHVPVEDALLHVAGYSVFNDGSIRDVQLRTSQWTLGKNFDQTGGFGPDLVTPDELPPGASGLRIQTRLNGEVLQDSNTDQMIFGTAEVISILSECLTLLPGDVIVMGTCEGIGLARKPQIFMKHGDICEVEIEGIGVLSNPIVDEQA